MALGLAIAAGPRMGADPRGLAGGKCGGARLCWCETQVDWAKNAFFEQNGKLIAFPYCRAEGGWSGFNFTLGPDCWQEYVGLYASGDWAVGKGL